MVQWCRSVFSDPSPAEELLKRGNDSCAMSSRHCRTRPSVFPCTTQGGTESISDIRMLMRVPLAAAEQFLRGSLGVLD